MSIITSLLDQDLYSFTQGQCILHQFAGCIVEYKFKCRTPGINIVQYLDEIKYEVEQWCNLKFTKSELEYLKTIHYLKSDYIEYLRNFQPNYENIRVSGVETDSLESFDLTISGPWITTIYAEVPLLAIVNEVYFSHADKAKLDIDGPLKAKIDYIKNNTDSGFKFMDFGTRRRFSKQVHAYIVAHLKRELPENLIGTSNVLLAKDYNLTPRGTMSHQLMMGCQSLVRISESQKFAFQKWSDEYRGNLGIALSDTLGMDAFFKDFDLYFSKLFSGARQDSGDPYLWCEKLIAHYEKLKIDPRTKTAVFSDGLTAQTATDIYNKFKGKIDMSFGIGTSITNDCGFEPIQIVIKLTRANGQDVAKLSDSPGKQMCENANYLKYLKQQFQIKES